MNENEKLIIKRLGEDTAYTFKGLHKQADWSDKKYKLYLSVPIIFSIVSLGFDEEIASLALKCIAVLSLIVTVFALMDQKEFEKSNGYRDLADRIKFIYDKAERCFALDDFSQYETLCNEWDLIRKDLKDYPIGSLAYKRTRKVINQEMNLSWLGAGNC